MISKKHKTLRTPLLILTILIFYLSASGGFFTANATIRYVSHTGSNTPPYTSWATAADSIMSAINISVFGDTIFVANGSYKEEVVMIAGLSLIGAGTDSCIIDTRSFNNPHAVGVNSNCLLKNFKIIVQNSPQSIGTGVVIENSNSIIEYNKILNAGSFGIRCDNTNSILRHNRIIHCNRGIFVEFNQPTIDSNYIYIELQAGKGINPNLGSDPLIRGNTIVLNNGSNSTFGYWSGFNFSANVKNNLFYSLQSDVPIHSEQQEDIVSNVVYGNYNTGIFKSYIGIIKNNSVTGGEKGIRIASGSSPPQIQYNNVWDNETNYYNYSPDSTNISVDPMFVNPDSMDFHLQMYSPLIDAGDPNILDKDSSRSDIGLYGGPFGESYIYLDLAPRPPVNLTAEVDSNKITVSWNHNTEADFNHYSLFRDTTAGFTADSTTFILSLTDTFYTNIIPEGTEAFYYKLTATDNQGNTSELSEELAVLITSVNEYPTIVSNYQLYQNYPNPFNPSTKIGYKLRERGYVKLYVYDIKGELIEVLINKFQDVGFYEVEFDVVGTGLRPVLASGVYIYQIHVISENNIPVFTDIKKMIYIK